MNMKLKKLLNDIQKTEDKIAELQEHLKRQNTLRQQMEDIEIIKSFRSMKLDSRSLLVLLDGIQKGTVTIQMDEDGGITVEDAKAPQKKENNEEVHRPPVGQMTEREVLDDEESSAKETAYDCHGSHHDLRDIHCYGLCKCKPTGRGDNDTGSRRNGNRINRRYGEERGYRKGHRGRG